MKTFDDIASTLLFILLIILVTMFGLAVQGCADKNVKTSSCNAKFEYNCECDCAKSDLLKVIDEVR